MLSIVPIAKLFLKSTKKRTFFNVIRSFSRIVEMPQNFNCSGKTIPSLNISYPPLTMSHSAFTNQSRSFHTSSPSYLAAIEANVKTFGSIVLKSKEPVVVDFYAELRFNSCHENRNMIL